MRKRHFLLCSLFLLLVVLCPNSWGFSGVGDCQKLIADYAVLTEKSVYLSNLINGNCVVNNEKDFSFILKSAGYNYKETKKAISITEIVPYQKPSWIPKEKKYKISFVFVNLSSAIDCGIKLDDILATFKNLNYNISIGGSLGCPALDNDGSYSMQINASLYDVWHYSNGQESSRTESQITSATGAVTTNLKWVTSGLDLTLTQTENNIKYQLRYTSKDGSVTQSSGGVVELVEAVVFEEIKVKRYLWFIPLGWKNEKFKYKIYLNITEIN